MIQKVINPIHKQQQSTGISPELNMTKLERYWVTARASIKTHWSITGPSPEYRNWSATETTSEHQQKY
jgi:hypothetical protein